MTLRIGTDTVLMIRNVHKPCPRLPCCCHTANCNMSSWVLLNHNGSAADRRCCDCCAAKRYMAQGSKMLLEANRSGKLGTSLGKLRADWAESSFNKKNEKYMKHWWHMMTCQMHNEWWHQWKSWMMTMMHHDAPIVAMPVAGPFLTPPQKWPIAVNTPHWRSRMVMENPPLSIHRNPHRNPHKNG